MTRLGHVTLALVATMSGLLLATGMASAHAGELHTADGLGNGDGLGLIAVALIAGAVWWLAHRTGARPPRPDPPHRTDLPGPDGSPEPRPSIAAVTRADGKPTNTLVAIRRLHPPR